MHYTKTVSQENRNAFLKGNVRSFAFDNGSFGLCIRFPVSTRDRRALLLSSVGSWSLLKRLTDGGLDRARLCTLNLCLCLCLCQQLGGRWPRRWRANGLRRQRRRSYNPGLNQLVLRKVLAEVGVVCGLLLGRRRRLVRNCSCELFHQVLDRLSLGVRRQGSGCPVLVTAGDFNRWQLRHWLFLRLRR